MSREQIEREVRAVPVWYHSIDLGHGIVTPGFYDMRPFLDRYRFPVSFAGLTVLDVGASNGYFSFEFERRGARRVIGTDLPSVLDHDYPEWLKDEFRATYDKDQRDGVDRQELKQGFEVARDALGSKVERLHTRIYDLPSTVKEPVDWAFCGSVLVHLRDPVGAIEAVRRVVKPGGGVVIATPVHHLGPSISSALFVGEPRRCAWWVFSPAALVKACEAAGLKSVEYVGDFEITTPHDPPIVDTIGIVHARA